MPFSDDGWKTPSSGEMGFNHCPPAMHLPLQSFIGSHGQEWQFPKRMSKRVALSALVYGALLNAQETISAYSSKYRISIEIENLDVEDDEAQ